MIAIKYETWGTRWWTAFELTGDHGERHEIEEKDALRLLGVEADEADELRPDNWYVVGVGKRLIAGLTSLCDRAHLGLEVLEVGQRRPCSVYGDTDQPIRVCLGGGPSAMGSRSAYMEATVWLHRTVGGGAEWNWRPEHRDPAQGDIEVASTASPGQSSRASVEVLLILFPSKMQKMLNGIVDELAAMAVEGRLPECGEHTGAH